jgi:hypothetical protein
MYDTQGRLVKIVAMAVEALEPFLVTKLLRRDPSLAIMTVVARDIVDEEYTSILPGVMAPLLFPFYAWASSSRP